MATDLTFCKVVDEKALHNFNCVIELKTLRFRVQCNQNTFWHASAPLKILCYEADPYEKCIAVGICSRLNCFIKPASSGEVTYRWHRRFTRRPATGERPCRTKDRRAFARQAAVGLPRDAIVPKLMRCPNQNISNQIRLAANAFDRFKNL